ncbi:hypothetical protein PCA31118_04933 [Pandoraea captiosa]|uniref:Uncharacterized protein n=1 Tax=Pandoraea captiosa TaxID=2508302 RepID=A0A5E5AST9_9BURK|nr:hypothetical protein [Pandoraea captiosa]VVE75170.1 hypothetical protein PCA31118_04933 [Pandoraea captiosa]
MHPVSTTTFGTVPTTPSTPLAPQQRHAPMHERFRADIATIRLRHGGRRPIATAVIAEPVRQTAPHRRLPILAARRLFDSDAPAPAADFAFFREPLKQTPALIGQWSAAAKAGSGSEAWTQFVADISERFFKGSRKQRVMDALVLSLDILPPHDRADALACLLADGVEGNAAVEEFWTFVGMGRIPDADKARVAELIRRYGIGL